MAECPNTDIVANFWISEAEIIDFGRAFDPFPFHVDPVAARNSFFRRLCASGLHSAALAVEAAIALPAFSDYRLARVASIKHLTPLYADERVDVTIRGSAASKDGSERECLIEGRKASGKTVIAIEAQFTSCASTEFYGQADDVSFARSVDARDCLYFEDCASGTRFATAMLHVDATDLANFDRLIQRSAAPDHPGQVRPLHIFGLAQRLAHSVFWSRAAIEAGAGCTNLTWHAPLAVDDRLVLDFSIIEARPLKSRPDMGLVRGKSHLFRSSDEQLVLSFEGVAFLRRR